MPLAESNALPALRTWRELAGPNGGARHRRRIAPSDHHSRANGGPRRTIGSAGANDRYCHWAGRCAAAHGWDLGAPLAGDARTVGAEPWPPATAVPGSPATPLTPT